MIFISCNFFFFQPDSVDWIWDSRIDSSWVLSNGLKLIRYLFGMKFLTWSILHLLFVLEAYCKYQWWFFEQLPSKWPTNWKFEQKVGKNLLRNCYIEAMSILHVHRDTSVMTKSPVTSCTPIPLAILERIFEYKYSQLRLYSWIQTWAFLDLWL